MMVHLSQACNLWWHFKSQVCRYTHSLSLHCVCLSLLHTHTRKSFYSFTLNLSLSVSLSLFLSHSSAMQWKCAIACVYVQYICVGMMREINIRHAWTQPPAHLCAEASRMLITVNHMFTSLAVHTDEPQTWRCVSPHQRHPPHIARNDGQGLKLQSNIS